MEFVLVCPDCMCELDENRVCQNCKGCYEGNPLDVDD